MSEIQIDPDTLNKLEAHVEAAQIEIQNMVNQIEDLQISLEIMKERWIEAINKNIELEVSVRKKK